MLTVKTTDHLTGATICGNHSDLNTLYNALSNLVGNEGSYPEYDQCQLRILGLCYEIRHTYQGDRNTLEGIYGETNYSFEYLWPELIFIIGVLEEYCRLANGDRCYLLQNDDGVQHYRQGLKEELLDRLPDDIAYLQYFQSLIRNALRRTIDEKRFKRIFNAFDQGYSYTLFPQSYRCYCPQWIDIQNVKYLKRTPDKRRTYLATIAEKILFESSDYEWMKQSLLEYEKELGKPYYEIELEGMQYPDEIEW